MVTVEMLHSLLVCDAESGKLFWRARGESRAWDTRHAGKPALNYLDPISGYLRGAIFNRGYQAHRVIWAMASGFWPAEQIDHINGNRADNRIGNLREATQAQNKANGGKRVGRNSSSQFIGVMRIAATGRWGACVPANGQNNWCGTFATEEEAAKARDDMAIRVRGEFARLNFPQVSA